MRQAIAKIQVLDCFRRLARRVGAREAMPTKNGAVAFIFPTGQGNGAIIWWPQDQGGAYRHPGLSGCLVPQGIDAALLPGIAEDILSAVRRIDFLPIAFRRNKERPIQLSRNFINTNLSDYFEENRTCWGHFLARDVEEVSDGVIRLPFESENARVVFEIREAKTAESGGRDWHLFAPLAVKIAEDTRDETRKADVSEMIERYLFYALSRAIDPSQPIRATRLPAAETVSRARKTIPPEDRFGNTRSESSVHEFFRADRDLNHYDILTTLLEADNDLAVVFYGPDACQKHPTVSAVGYHSDRFASLATAFFRNHVQMTKMRELDFVMGGESHFRELVENAIKGENIKGLVVVTLCVADLIGVDIKGIVKDVLKGRPLPVFYVAISYSNIPKEMDLWSHLFRFADRAVSRRKGVVNLMGFLPQNHPSAVDIRRDLEQLGIAVNGFIGPSFLLASMQRFFEAELSVLSTDMLARREFEQAGEDHALDFVELAPPFGPGATIRFYRGILSRCASRKNHAAIYALWDRHNAEWAAWYSRARRFEVAVVVDPRTAKNLIRPPSLYGIDLLPLLSEMGFQVRVFYVARSSEDEADRLAQELKARFSALMNGQEPIRFQAVPRPEELPGVLKAAPSSLVFSEFQPDTRIIRAGKTPFYLRQLEMGFAGSLRSLIRLVRLAESRFPKFLSPVFPGRKG